MFRRVAIALIMSWTFWTASSLPSFAAAVDGAKIFEIQCAGCHANGGNIVRRGKTLKLKALQKNGYETVDAIAEIVTHGKANMSAYQDRLSEEEIQAVSKYVLEQAQNGWD